MVNHELKENLNVNLFFPCSSGIWENISAFHNRMGESRRLEGWLQLFCENETSTCTWYFFQRTMVRLEPCYKLHSGQWRLNTEICPLLLWLLLLLLLMLLLNNCHNLFRNRHRHSPLVLHYQCHHRHSGACHLPGYPVPEESVSLTHLLISLCSHLSSSVSSTHSVTLSSYNATFFSN